jgi:hypothetical protein
VIAAAQVGVERQVRSLATVRSVDERGEAWALNTTRTSRQARAGTVDALCSGRCAGATGSRAMVPREPRTENRGVPSSSLGLAIKSSPASAGPVCWFHPVAAVQSMHFDASYGGFGTSRTMHTTTALALSAGWAQPMHATHACRRSRSPLHTSRRDTGYAHPDITSPERRHPLPRTARPDRASATIKHVAHDDTAPAG